MYQPFGVSYSGASYKYTVLDTTGRRSAAQIGQLPQTSYHSLLTPYAFFGLGRTNNYIENLFVGSTRYTDALPNSSKQPLDSSQHFINMEGVIPNSKVVIYPPPPGVEVSASGWRRELYLRPGAWIPLVTLTVIIVTVILAIIVGVLHWNEKVHFSLTYHYGDTHYVYSEKMNLSEDEHHITSISMHSNLIFYGMVSLRVNFYPPF